MRRGGQGFLEFNGNEILTGRGGGIFHEQNQTPRRNQMRKTPHYPGQAVQVWLRQTPGGNRRTGASEMTDRQLKNAILQQTTGYRFI
jgi:hypothetical protein